MDSSIASSVSRVALPTTMIRIGLFAREEGEVCPTLKRVRVARGVCRLVFLR